MKVLVIGSGAREAAIIYKLCQSEAIGEIYTYPGNQAWILEDISKFFGVLPELEANQKASPREIILAAKRANIEALIVGPELSLSQGIVDIGQEHGVFVFGPHLENAKLESSKNFAKQIMTKAKVPTAQYKFFEVSEKDALKSYAKNFFKMNPSSKLVLKVSCLAAGKGVVICEDWTSFEKGLLYLSNEIGVEADGFVVEEFLSGRECSYFIICDGQGGFERLGFAVDYKRRFDKDMGPNTGGMGAYTPVEWLPANAADKVDEEIVRPMFEYFSGNDLHYRGFLYVGLMWNELGPKVVEFNVRLGDPEAQVLALSSTLDWGSFIKNSLDRFKNKKSPQVFSKKKLVSTGNASVAIVLSHPDYPSIHAKEQKEFRWTKEDIKDCMLKLKSGQSVESNLQIFSAACVTNSGAISPGKGRVLTVAAQGLNLQEARKNAYEFIEIFTQKFWRVAGYRKDIAKFD